MFYNNIRYSMPLHIVLLLTNWLPDNIIFLKFRGWLAHFFVKKCGKNLRLGRSVTFYNPANIFLGTDVYIAYGNWFSADAPIVISDEVVIGPYCVFASSNHTISNGSFRYGIPVSKQIFIDKGSWLGAHCTITAGTSIGKGACVAANSVTRRTLSSFSMYGGCPAILIKKMSHNNL